MQYLLDLTQYFKLKSNVNQREINNKIMISKIIIYHKPLKNNKNNDPILLNNDRRHLNHNLIKKDHKYNNLR